MENKKCSKCGEVKTINEFYKDKAKKDGYCRRCKECKKECHDPEKLKKWKEKNIEIHTEEYYQNLSGVKRCGKCKEVKFVSEFSKGRINKNGLACLCKECDKKKKIKYYKNNQEKINEKSRKHYKNNSKYYKEYHEKHYQENKEKYKEKKREYYQENKERITKRNKEYRKDNKEKMGEYQKEYRKDNKKKINKRTREWAKNNRKKMRKSENRYHKKYPEKLKKKQQRMHIKRISIPKYALSDRISSLMRRSLKGNKNGWHWESLVNFTLQDLIAHLEPLFKFGMNWQNMGKWHIDHKRPISSFNFNSYNDPEFKECWALDNLQPLWAKENLIKGNKI